MDEAKVWKSKAEKVQENKKAKKGLQSFITGSESFKGQSVCPKFEQVYIFN